MIKRMTAVSLLWLCLISICQGQDVQKMQQQMKALMSKEKQVELEKQVEQKALLEKQALLLAEKEKALLKLQFEQKKQALQHERNEAISLIQKNQLRAQIQTALKDKRINDQQKAISSTYKWILYLIVLSLLIVIVAAFIYLNQQKTKRLNRIVVLQHQELQKIGLVKDRLFSLVGHDLRSPFNLMISLSSLLRNGNISAEKMTVYMNQLESTLAHTSKLMDNLLLWAESQLQGYKPMLGQYAIRAIVEQVLDLKEINAKGKDITLLNEVLNEDEAIGDANMIAIVLRNLINNAIKFTPAGGMIKISARKADGFLDIAISDNGIGISEESMEQFNHASFQPHESTAGTSGEKGTGLGLMLCKTFTQLMNGRIGVSKNPNASGSIFTFSLPLQQHV